MSETSIQENVDFNGDHSFTGADLDISWAYLQVKALLDSGSSDVTTENFRQKVIDQYNLNKSAGIAEPSDSDPLRLPGKFSKGLPLGIPQTIFTRRWTMNDMWADSGANSHPTDLWESINGELSGTTTNLAWTDSKVNDTNLSYLAPGGTIGVDDKGAFRNDKSWTFHFYAKINTFDGVLLSKGHDKSNYDSTPFFQIVVNKKQKKIGVYTGYGVKNWFVFPYKADGNKLLPFEIQGRFCHFYLQRDGQMVRMFIDNGVDGCLEFPQEVVGALPDLINMNDMDAPVELSGDKMSVVKDIWFADNELKGDDILNISGDSHRYRFRHDLNLTSSYFSFKNFFQDQNGNYAQIYFYHQAKPFQGSETNQGHWTTENTTDGTQFGWTPQTNVLKFGRSTDSLEIKGVNFKSNFTISFWVRTGSITPFFNLRGKNGNFTLQQTGDKAKFRMKYGANKRVDVPSTLSSAPLENDWHHITLVKNRNLLGLWVNGQFDNWGFCPLTDTEIENIGFADIDFRGDTNSPVYYSGIRVLDYAMCNVPAKGKGVQSNYDFIDVLKQSAS